MFLKIILIIRFLYDVNSGTDFAMFWHFDDNSCPLPPRLTNLKFLIHQGRILGAEPFA